MNSGIEYRPWPCAPRYLAGEDGSIVGPSGRVLRPLLRKRDGYLVVTVYVGPRRWPAMVHLIVAEAWHGPRPEGLEVAHGNGVQTDCRPENLRWATHLENMADAFTHGTVARGARLPQTRLTEDAVRAIRTEYATGAVSQRQIGERYGVGQMAISDIVRGKTWKHVA